MMLKGEYFHITDNVTSPTAVLECGVPGIQMVDIVQSATIQWKMDGMVDVAQDE